MRRASKPASGKPAYAGSLSVANVHGAVLSRRQFVKTGGSLVVGVGVIGANVLTTAVSAQGRKNSLDPARVTSWLEIHADNTVTLRTGQADFGQSTVTTAYKQIVADELYMTFEAVTTVIMGDTDRTPNGGVSAGFLHIGGPNFKKAAAYTREALLDLGAKTLGVDRKQVTVKDGVISGGGKTVTYGQLVSKQQLTLSIPVSGDPAGLYGVAVTGNPPLKPPSEYTVIGKPHANYVTASKVAAKEQWATDVRLPGMLHARTIHPKTLGSKLMAAGALDKKRFPNAQVIVQGNFIGVVAPTEWEAIGASQQVAAGTTWTEWKGLPGHTNLHAWMREKADWKTAPVTKGRESAGNPAAAIAGAAKKLSATYEVPYHKHAPIGPTMALADVKADGTVFVYTHNQHAAALRSQLAMMLKTSIDNVVVRSFAGPGHYGRSNGGNAGAEDEAVLLSKAVGHPVRVQWMRPDDLMWSTSSPAGFSNVQIALGADGAITGLQIDHHMPAMQDDRPIGAILAGLPTMPAPAMGPPGPGGTGSIANASHDPWVYDRVPNVALSAYGTYQIGEHASPLATGIRDHSMRTPGQLQQNFPRELAINEAAALAGVDPIEFRLRHTTDKRLIAVLNAVRTASKWQTRMSPQAGASTPNATGHGVAVMLRSDTYWACTCQISVNRTTGKVTVDKIAVAVEPGIVINPVQIKRQVQGGTIMGISHALYEEARFDEGAFTSRDWRTYPIATMADAPDVEVVVIDNRALGRYGGVSEAANAIPLAAIAAAFHDATGKVPRKLPLTPEYVTALLADKQSRA